MNHHKGNHIKRFIGALRLRNSAIYLGMAIKGLGAITRPIESFIQSLSLLKTVSPPKNFRCIVIVCPPRSGGTLTYQVLTRSLPSIFLANIHSITPFFGTKLFRLFSKRNKKTLPLKNCYGYTSSLYDVHEGNEFFTWLDGLFEIKKHENQREEIRSKFMKLITMLSPAENEIAIFKNMRTYLHIANLHKALPEIVFVRVRRDPQRVVQSSLRAFSDTGTFHPVPPPLLEMPLTDPTDFAIMQIKTFNKILDEQFEQLPQSSRFEIDYEEFCNDPYRFINELVKKFPDIPESSIKQDLSILNLKPSVTLKVSQSDWSRISEVFKK